MTKNWFDKYSISWNESSRVNKIGGTSVSIRGNSSILASFLTKLVGSGSQNKHVPSEAFIANDEFIIGFGLDYDEEGRCLDEIYKLKE